MLKVTMYPNVDLRIIVPPGYKGGTIVIKSHKRCDVAVQADKEVTILRGDAKNVNIPRVG